MHIRMKKKQLIYYSSFTTTVSTHKNPFCINIYIYNILCRRGFPWDILFRKTKLLGSNVYTHMLERRARIILLCHNFWQFWIIFLITLCRNNLFILIPKIAQRLVTPHTRLQTQSILFITSIDFFKRLFIHIFWFVCILKKRHFFLLLTK